MTADVSSGLQSTAPDAKNCARRWAWVPIPLLLLAIAGLWLADLDGSHESAPLALALNIIFYGVGSFIVASLIGRSYFIQGKLSLLLLTCGILAWVAAGLVGVAAGLVEPNSEFNFNTAVTIHNSCAWLSGFFHLMGLVFSKRLAPMRARALWLTGACVMVFGLVAVLTIGALKGWLPVFFVSGQGGTIIRQLVLGMAMVMFAMTAVFLLATKRGRSSFMHWYSLAMGLIAIGLLGVLVDDTGGSILCWVGRGAQYLSGIYMLVAAFASARETGGWNVSLEFSEWDERLLRLIAPERLSGLPVVWRYGLAAGLALLGTTLRVAVIPWAGTVAPYNIPRLSLVISTVLLGSGPGLVTLVLGDLGAEIFVLGSLPVMLQGSTLGRLGLDLMVGSLVVAVLHGGRVAVWQARRSAARLESFGAATFEGIVESEGGRLIDCNEQYARMYGSTVAEMRGLTIDDLFAREDLERVRANVLQNRESILEYEMLRKDGTRIMVEAHGRPVSPGSRRRHTAIRDITLRKKAEEALRQTNEELEQRVAQRTAELVKAGEQVRAERQRFLDMLETLPVIIDIIRADHRIEWANRAFREALGDCSGKLCYASQFNRETPCVECEAFTPLKTGKPHHWEWTLPNGRTFDIHNFPFTASDGTPAVLEMDIDITEIRKAQATLREANATLEQKVTERTAELRKSEERERQRAEELAALLDAVPTPVIIVHDAESTHMTGNRAADELLRQPRGGEISLSAPEERRPRHFKAYKDGRELALHELPAQRAARGELIKDFEFSLVFEDGTRHELLGYGTPLHDEAGQPRGAVHGLVDITERKRAEQKLRELTQRLTYHVDTSPLAVIEWGPDMRLTRWSGAAEKVFGWKTEEVLGKRQEDFRWIYEEDKEKVAGVTGELVSGANPKRFSANRNYRKDGSVVHCEWYNSSLRDENGKLRSILSLVLDVTERKQAEEALRKSEERYRVVAQTMLQGMVHQNADGTITAMNPAAESILGKTKADFVGSSSMKEEQFTVREDGSEFPGIEHPAMVALRSGEVVRGVVMGVYNSRLKERRWISIDAIPLSRPGESRPSEVYTIFEDITERKEMLEALTQAKEQLRRHAENLEKTVEERTAKLREMVGELEHFSYTITHDMRAPLRAMQGFSQLMLESGCEACPNEVSVGMLKRIMTGANRMDQLITDALNYARIVRAELPMTPVELGPLVQGILDTYPNLQPPKVEVRVDGELPVVMGNEAALTQCFSNLLGNAAKFVEDGKTPKVRIWAEAPKSDGTGLLKNRVVRIWVEDNGIGIPAHYHTKIFEMFGRVDKKYEGTGIGLALVRKNVERMGGKVGVESEPGKGSRFWMELQSGAK